MRSNDEEQTDILVTIMEKVGGYSELMNMPFIAVKEVADSLRRINKEAERRSKKK